MNFCGMRNGRTLAAMSRRRSLLYKLHRVVTFSCLVGVLTSLAAYGEGVTRAESNIPWCCDIYTNGKLRKDASLKKVEAHGLSCIPDVRILKGDDRTAYRDPAVWYENGTFHLFFTLVETESDKSVFSYVAMVESQDLVHWTTPRKLTLRDGMKDYSSPGNVVADGADRILCFQSYPRPGNRDDGVVRYANQTARLFTMRSRDLRSWSAPRLIKVKGPAVTEQDMGRMIDPYLLRDRQGSWWCFYKQRGASIARSDDLENWTPVGRTDAGENVCVLETDGRYVMFHSPRNGIGRKTSTDLLHWTDEPGLITLGQKEWSWAAGRLTAGAVLDGRRIPGVGKYLLFFHGSGPRRESEGDFDRNASIGLAWSDDLENWSWPGCP